MRFVLASDYNYYNSCGSYYEGETEDYSIFINPNVPCSSSPTAGTIFADTNNVCVFQPFNLYLQNNSTGIGISYQWQKSSDNITFTRIPGANYSFYRVESQDSTTYYRCSVRCGNSTASSSS